MPRPNLPSPGPVPNDEIPGWLDALVPQAVAATFWIDPGPTGKPYNARIKFIGRRVGVSAKLTAADRFEQVETIQQILPGSGPIAVTTTAVGVNPGEWVVTAEMVDGRQSRTRSRLNSRPDSLGQRPSLLKVLGNWGTPSMAQSLPGPIESRRKPFAVAAGSLSGSWPILVMLGVILGLALQSVLIARSGLNPWPVTALTIAAALAGIVGAKLWFMAAERTFSITTLSEGLCIQGFIAGAVLVLLGGILLFRLPPGIVADNTAPALFFGIALGRPGCFFTGCCSGRPTSSRWALWSSDRRIGARRFPVQLWEATLGLALGLGTLALDWQRLFNVPGAIALGGLAAYTLGRQVLFAFRAEARRSPMGRPSSIAIAGAVLAGDVVCWVITCL